MSRRPAYPSAEPANAGVPDIERHISLVKKIAYLLNGARLLGCSGVRLKDNSEDETLPQLQTPPPTVPIQGDFV